MKYKTVIEPRCISALAFLLMVSARSALAQQPSQPPPPAPPSQQPAPPATSIYRAPLIALVQPADGGVVPRDKPVVVFRFAQGEPNDPLDARSFAVSVDGEYRTSLFQQTAGNAWDRSPRREPPSPGALTTSSRASAPVAARAHP